jgi:hypothetical protein
VIAGLTLGSVLLGIALLLIVILYLARPFVVPEDEAVRLDREEVDSLVLRRDALLRQIRDLDDDMEAAKVAPELYQRNRPQLVRQAAVIMQQLDAHGYGHPSPDAPSALGRGTATAASPDAPSPLGRGMGRGSATAPDIDAQMEAAVRRLRTPQEVDADIEAAVRAARAGVGAGLRPAPTATAAPVAFCPRCGRRVEADERFCPKCGYALAPEPAKAHV